MCSYHLSGEINPQAKLFVWGFFTGLRRLGWVQIPSLPECW